MITSQVTHKKQTNRVPCGKSCLMIIKLYSNKIKINIIEIFQKNLLKWEMLPKCLINWNKINCSYTEIQKQKTSKSNKITKTNIKMKVRKKYD